MFFVILNGGIYKHKTAKLCWYISECPEYVTLDVSLPAVPSHIEAHNSNVPLDAASVVTTSQLPIIASVALPSFMVSQSPITQSVAQLPARVSVSQPPTTQSVSLPIAVATRPILQPMYSDLNVETFTASVNLPSLSVDELDNEHNKILSDISETQEFNLADQAKIKFWQIEKNFFPEVSTNLT